MHQYCNISSLLNKYKHFSVFKLIFSDLRLFYYP